jgi:hypothetical protein
MGIITFATAYKRTAISLFPNFPTINTYILITKAIPNHQAKILLNPDTLNRFLERAEANHPNH